ncbi:response regulator transcription factor [Photobacterium minamisatsumaniensis]|uniref:response regulator transcription factor n=1 Tax=Photobacterium minamisatsumaniensis TaxID=2910233 RepID=UPI003D12A4ED
MTTQTKQVDPAMILIVEDDNDLADLISMHLSFQGHEVTRVITLEQARCSIENSKTAENPFDLLVLDRGLEDGDGLTLCQELRQQDNWLPVLMLTARDTEKDKVDGLESGADDYLTKPFSVLEFQARVRSILRRKVHPLQPHNNDNTESKQSLTIQANEEKILSFEGLTIRPQSHQVELGDQPISLTATEFTLLHFLASKPGRVYSKDELLDRVWQTNFSGYHHTVCSTINRLRTKLELPYTQHKYIHTVWGVGYKFQARPSAA